MKLFFLLIFSIVCNISYCQIDCNNWLKTSNFLSTVSIGDFDISGNKITVECNFNSLAVTSNGSWGHLVSKHTSDINMNYALSPNGAEIRTSNGYFFANQTCSFLLNKNYHVALVYDGSSLKFYRNGFLIKQTFCSGTLNQNDLLTTIGNVSSTGANSEQVNGYINEVRIWNVARTQTELRTYMNTSLPNPTSQTGLLGYYTFDNLLNKQGNATFNGTLNGSASINQTNTSCTFQADSCGVIIPNTCNNWLSTPSNGSFVTLGDLDVSGNQITVEANFNRNQPLNNGLYYGHLISKHTGPSNVNYALLPNGCEISTTNGYFSTFQTCPPTLNKTYHVAMVYNGATLKFYRNGFLLSSQSCSGNLITNDLLTTISQISSSGSPTNNQVLGFVNEVRIWNVARTQTELRTYMNTSLPNPTTQTGLLGYYTFDNLLNKQGNATFNGTLNGSASINQTNTSCTFQADSCSIIVNTGTSKIINDYTPILALNTCNNRITVEDATAFNVGDTVLMIQMKGAVIDSTNTANFGTITDYKSAGNYEYNYVKGRSGNIIELKNNISRTYEIPTGKVQLIRVPYYDNYTVVDTLTCLPWDGKKGGVLVFNVQNTLTLTKNIDVSGKGFKGGIDSVSNPSSLFCHQSNYYYPNNPDIASQKGEGIADISIAKSYGRGALANGGGGGNSHNSGGGGGGNGAKGGFGGYEYDGTPCNDIVPYDIKGVGGQSLLYNNISNKAFMGGGGGAGQSNNPEGFQSNGGSGGAIIIIQANSIVSNSNKIIANGTSGKSCGSTSSGCHEGMGGGGGGGTILLNVNNYTTNTSIEVSGGKGADMTASGFGKVGPGGGGSGGVLWFKQSSLPINISSNLNGANNGVCVSYANDSWGATAGQIGQTLFNLNLPITTIPFKANIDSVRFDTTRISCTAYNFNGLAYTNTNPIQSWNWSFGDGFTANTQNTSHNFNNGGTFTVKLVVMDINGCKDSISRVLVISPFTSTISPNSSVCHGKTIQLNATGGSSYIWSPSTFLSNPNIANPTASPTNNIKYNVTITNALGCTKQDSVSLTYIAAPIFSIGSSKNSLCENDTLSLFASGGTQYTWTPTLSLNNSNISNPIGTPLVTTNYSVQIINNTCNDTIVLSKNILVNLLPTIVVTKSSDIDCTNPVVQLNATGANSYLWTPNIGLNSAVISNPTSTLTANQLYTVKGTDLNGCIGTSSILVNASFTDNGRFLIPSIFTPNGDGVNDCFGISHWGNVIVKDFSIYNRWGQKVFFTTNPNKCWDGKVNGVLQNNAAFVYQIRVESLCGNVYRKGTVIVAK